MKKFLECYIYVVYILIALLVVGFVMKLIPLVIGCVVVYAAVVYIRYKIHKTFGKRE